MEQALRAVAVMLAELAGHRDSMPPFTGRHEGPSDICSCHFFWFALLKERVATSRFASGSDSARGKRMPKWPKWASAKEASVRSMS